MAIEATEEELIAGRGYEGLFVPALFAPWPKHLISAVGIEAGSHVLDIACGTGVLTRAALAQTGPSGRVAGLDPAPGMLAAAAEITPEIEWVLGTAEELPFDGEAFDCVVCQFGMMFFQDRQKAAAEMFRVAKPGGALSLAIWQSIDQNPAFQDIVAVLEEHVSAEAGNAVTVPFSLGDSGVVERHLSQAGFSNISVALHKETARFPSTRTMVEVELRGWLPLFGIHLGEDQIADVLEKSDARLSKYAAPSGEAIFDTSAYVVTAKKPG